MIQGHKKTLVCSLLAALLIFIVAGEYGKNAVGQTRQQQKATSSANMTVADFNPVTNILITARQGILNNDTVSAYTAINTAGGDLFGLSLDAAGGNETLVKQLINELRPVQDYLDNTRDALRDNNSTHALRSLNTADLTLLYITQGLPPGEVAEEETAE
jgi:hypothetical protein